MDNLTSALHLYRQFADSLRNSRTSERRAFVALSRAIANTASLGIGGGIQILFQGKGVFPLMIGMLISRMILLPASDLIAFAYWRHLTRKRASGDDFDRSEFLRDQCQQDIAEIEHMRITEPDKSQSILARHQRYLEDQHETQGRIFGRQCPRTPTDGHRRQSNIG